MQTINSTVTDCAAASSNKPSLKLKANKSVSDLSYARHQSTNLHHREESQRPITEVTSQSDQRSINSKQIRLFVHHSNELQHNFDKDNNPKLSRLLDEYKTKISFTPCEVGSCKSLRILSHKLVQCLLENIDIQKLCPRINLKVPQSHVDNLSEATNSNLNTMEHNGFIDLVMEKDKRIQDLEKLLEVQKRLRVQDANQVEEKAARIKEWVANKLRELENQNRQLRDQNKKHKETVDTLSNRLESLSHLCTPRRTVKPDMTKLIDRFTSASQNETGTYPYSPIAQSRKKSLDSSGHLKINLDNQSFVSVVTDENQSTNFLTSTESSREKPYAKSSHRTESPIYDSVSIDKTNQEPKGLKKDQEESITSELVPPPPPLHQRDRWELELYSLADGIFSSLNRKTDDNSYFENDIVTSGDSYLEHRVSRKSTSSVRNDLISLVKPNFTTIDGNNVFDDDSIDASQYSSEATGKISDEWTQDDSKSRFMSTERKKDLEGTKQEMGNQPILMTFDSPLRSKLGKDCLLKTQSVRRSIESERLFNFISSDLVKRGWLIKTGTLKNHLRWIVLKNFNLHVYKNEADELSKLKPLAIIKLSSDSSVHAVNQSGDSSFPFRILYNDKYLQLIADSSIVREEWIRILTVTINMSNIDSRLLTKQNASCEGLLSITRHGHTKRCYAILIHHVLFLLRSITDPVPLSYLSLKMAKIREITNNFDHNLEDDISHKSSIQDCSIAIYPKYSLNLDPLYMTMGNQQETDKWLHHLTTASCTEQTLGTLFEQTLTKFMVDKSMKRDLSNYNASGGVGDSFYIQYTDQPLSEPLTTLPNETLKAEALELFKSILLITRVPVEPIAVDYHVSLIQNCLSKFLKFPELRNEFFAQLIKQSNYVRNQFTSPKLSSSSSGCSVEIIQHKDFNQAIPYSIVNHDNSESSSVDWKNFAQSSSNGIKEKDYNYNYIPCSMPTQTELLQVLQIIALAVSLNLPKGRIRWWLLNSLEKIAHSTSDIGKYALYTLNAIQRTNSNGSRENVPSRTEIMSIILRNPYDHSNPHSLPVSFSDGSYLVVEADGSTTVEEFITTLLRNIDLRESSSSDFYLFADDPSGSKDLHILEPYRKVLDVVGWWEQTFRMNNHGKYENTKVIKLIFKKRLVLKAEDGETNRERLLIVHQFHHEVTSHKIHLNDSLVMELVALMAQITYGNFIRLENASSLDEVLEKVVENLVPRCSSQPISHRDQTVKTTLTNRNEMGDRWKQLSDKSPEDCVRVYLNCIRRLNLCLDNCKQVSS